MNILVVGGAGYIGSMTVRRLVERGYPVWVYDNFSRGHRAAVPSAINVEGDLADEDRLTETLRAKSIDAVIHFAALAQVGDSVADPSAYYRVNVVGSQRLLEAMRRAGVTRIVFSSTTATYGEPERMPITEDTPQRPINPYGFTKLVVERMLCDYARAFGIAPAALRYFNAAGADPSGQFGESASPQTRIIPLTLEVALGKRKHIRILGDDYPTPDGTCIRDFIHIDDLADAHIRVLDQLRPGTFQAFNLGNGRGFSVKEVIEACRRVSGHPIPAEIAPRRPGDPPILIADASKARDVLGWTPRFTDMEDIVRTAWNWHRTHPNGYGG